MSLLNKLEQLERLKYEDTKEAVLLARELAEEAPEDPSVLRAVGSVLRMANRLAEARGTLNLGLSLCRDSNEEATMLMAIACLWIDSGRPKLAQAICDDAIAGFADAGNPNGIGECLYTKGVASFFTKDYSETIRQNQSCLVFLAEDNRKYRFSALASMATCFANLGDLEKASRYAFEAKPFEDAIPGAWVRSLEVLASICEQEERFIQAGAYRYEIARAFVESSSWLNAAMSVAWAIEDFLRGNDLQQAMEKAESMLPVLIEHMEPDHDLASALIMKIWRSATFARHNLTAETVYEIKKRLQGLIGPGAGRENI